MASGGGAPAAEGARVRDVKQALSKYWVEPWKELAGDVAGSKLLASGADMAKEMFVEPWRENIAELVEVAKPLAQRANAAAAAVIRSPSSGAVSALPSPPNGEAPAASEPRSHAPAPAPLIVDLPASYFPAPPGEAEPQRRAPGVARPPVPGAEPPPPPPPRTYFQGSGRAAAPAPPIMMTPLEIQRLANARAAAARQQQAAHFSQHAARPPLPSGAMLVGAPAPPPPHAVAEARRVREAAAASARAHAEASQAAAAAPGGEDAAALAKRLDDMFSVIETLPRGVSAEAEDWAAVAVAERAATLRGAGGSSGSLHGGGGPFTAGAAEAIAAAAAARGAAARDGGAAARGAAAEEAERARQRLAALRAAHPDSFPINPKALYTPWRDDAASARAGAGSQAFGVEDDDDDDELATESHVAARLLGPRWRVRLAAALAVLTCLIYLRGERAGWGVEGTGNRLLTWHAGDAAALEGGNRTHAQLAIVVRAADSDAAAAMPPPTTAAAEGAEALQAQAAAAVEAAKADAAPAAPVPAQPDAAAAEAAAKALAEATQTGAARRLLRRTQPRGSAV